MLAIYLNAFDAQYIYIYRERVVRQYKIVKPDVTEEEIDEALSNEGGDSIFASQILSQGMYMFLFSIMRHDE